jgi:DNA-binding CsgD family transcriptional regulator
MTATGDDELRAAFRLTPSEARVAMLLAARRTNREIAAELGVTEHTARRHTEKVLLKLNVHRRHDVQGALLRCRKSSDRG